MLFYGPCFVLFRRWGTDALKCPSGVATGEILVHAKQIFIDEGLLNMLKYIG